MGRLVRILMNEGLEHSWRSSHEKEAIQAIKRECFSKSQLDCMREYVNLQNGMYSLKAGSLENIILTSYLLFKYQLNMMVRQIVLHLRNL